MKKSKLTILLLTTSLSFAADKDLDPISSNDGEYDLKERVLEEAIDSRRYLEYLKSEGAFDDDLFRLKLSLAPFTKEISREIDTYNYRKRQDSKIPLVATTNDPQESIEYTNEWRDAIFKHIPDESGFLGWGLYTAATPGTSRSYGGGKDELSMAKITFPKNTRLLDLRVFRGEGSYFKNDENFWHSSNDDWTNAYYIPIQNELYDRLKTKCPNIISARQFVSMKDEGISTRYTFVDKPSLTRDQYCNDLFTQALTDLNIGGIQYFWWYGELNKEKEICNSEDDTKNIRSAFVIANSPLNKETTATITNKADLSKMSEKDIKELEYIFASMNQFYFTPTVAATGQQQTFATRLFYDDMYLDHRLPEWANDLPSFLKRIPPRLDKKQYIERSKVGYHVPSRIYFSEGDHRNHMKKLSERTMGCLEKYRKEDSPTFDISRAQALFIQEVKKRANKETVAQTNQFLSDCFKDKSVELDPIKESDIAPILEVAGKLLNN